MIPRHQLAVAPRITFSSLVRAAFSQFDSSAEPLAALASNLRRVFSASDCVLTDSGTSALVLALRLTVPPHGIVALPSYGCVDLTSAIRFAGLRARLYDLEPHTLSPDLDSVKGVLERGVHALLVAHYYGYAADVAAVRTLASSWGVPVVEDAAQAAGGTVAGVRLGSLGEISILSFGRGKGLFGGRGGALLVRSAEWSRRLAAGGGRLGVRRGSLELFSVTSQWALGRPALYAVPASIPALRLGEMVYRPAHEPTALSSVAATLARIALRDEPEELASRRRKAALLHALSTEAHELTAIQPISGSDSGYLRFAVIDQSGSRPPAHRLGVMPGYPRTLHEQPELASQLLPGEPATPGATVLRNSLFTLPTHSFVTGVDLLALNRWMAPAKTAQNPAESERARGETPLLAEGWGR